MHVSRVNHADLCAAEAVSPRTSDGDKRSMPFGRENEENEGVRSWELIFVTAWQV